MFVVAGLATLPPQNRPLGTADGIECATLDIDGFDEENIARIPVDVNSF